MNPEEEKIKTREALIIALKLHGLKSPEANAALEAYRNRYATDPATDDFKRQMDFMYDMVEVYAAAGLANEALSELDLIITSVPEDDPEFAVVRARFIDARNRMLTRSLESGSLSLDGQLKSENKN